MPRWPEPSRKKRTCLSFAWLLFLLPASVAAASPWTGSIEVIRGDSDGSTIGGFVFEDSNSDSQRQSSEPGIPGVMVSNGLDVVITDSNGWYEIPVRPDMDLTVVQPAGWLVPIDERMAPRFAYTHKPGGTPEQLRFGGLPDTGPAPSQVNFPLRRAAAGDRFTCAIIGDSQAYSNNEAGQYRDSAVADLLHADLDGNDCMLYVGDVVGDDLELIDRILSVGSVVGIPQWLVHGNHDFDFDASDDAHSSDSWRRIWGPNYYAFEIGEATFIVLDNIVYPCGPDDMQLPGREFCGDPNRQAYNVRVTDTQLQWMDNLLQHVPEDRLIIVATHGPLVSFMAAGSTQHQDDAAADIHRLLEGREALSLSGHTHTMENLAPGEHFAGWKDAVNVDPLPFRHIIAGAASGNWWQGDFGLDGDAHALQRMGAPKGVLMLEAQGTAYKETYVGSRIDPRRGQWVDFNTPTFREWFDAIYTWRDTDRQTRDPIPPLSVNDLPDTRILTHEELREGVYVTANVWAGSSETTVEAVINGERKLTLARTQEGQGEAPRIGADYADPFASKRQLTVARFAIQSRSGIERNQGYEAYRGTTFFGVPQPQTAVADRNVHLWRARMPEDLPDGSHLITVTSTDRNGHQFIDHVIFEVMSERPYPHHRQELWIQAEWQQAQSATQQ